MSFDQILGSNFEPVAPISDATQRANTDFSAGHNGGKDMDEKYYRVVSPSHSIRANLSDTSLKAVLDESRVMAAFSSKALQGTSAADFNRLAIRYTSSVQLC